MHNVSIRDLKNNPASMTARLEQGHSVFVTKRGKPIGVTLPLDDSVVDHSLKELLYFDLYNKGEISFGKLAKFLGVTKPQLRRMFTAMEMPVIDYSVDEVAKELETFKAL